MTLPPLPRHPEPHTYAWTKLEIEEIEAYGKKCFDAALAQPAPIGYIDRKDIDRLTTYKATIWPGTNEIDAVAVYLAPSAQPVQPAQPTEKEVITACNAAGFFITHESVKDMRRAPESFVASRSAIARPAQPATTREGFEAWASDDGGSPKAIERDQSRNYKLMQTNTLWRGCAFGMREEREACEKACEKVHAETGECPELALHCRDAIRARSNE